jgi:hypothetical protein
VALTAEQKVTLQKVLGCLLYYACAVHSTMLVTLITITSAQKKCTDSTADTMIQLLNYCATHPDAEVRFHASNMVLHISSDDSYHSEPEARSRTGGSFYLGQKDGQYQLINGPILCLSSIMIM